MKAQISLRKAKLEDLQNVLNLVTELAIYEKEPEAVTASLLDYQNAWNNKLIDIIIAESAEQIVGMALYYENFSTWKGKMLYLEDFIVVSEYRGQGIGELIFDEFILEAKRRDCVMVKWQVLDWNEPALKFYSKKNATIEKEWWNGKIIF